MNDATLFYTENNHSFTAVVVFADEPTLGAGEAGVGYGEIEVLGDEIWLNNFAIRPDVRGKGWGQKVLQWFIEKYGVNTLTCAQSNKRALHIYKKYGFEIVDEAQSYEQGEIYIMKRR